MASINFLYRSTKDKANLNLRLLFRYDNKDYVFGAKTKVEVSKVYWSKQHKKKSKDISIANQQTKINSELNKIENHVLNAFNSVNPDSISKEWLISQVDYYYNPSSQNTDLPKDLISYIDFYIDKRKDRVKKNTIRKFEVLKSKLERFEASRKKQILIRDVNENFKVEFVEYCKDKKEDYFFSTIQRDVRHIKTLCMHANFLGGETHFQLPKLKYEIDKSKTKAEKIYLTFEDLAKIENLRKEKLNDSLEDARDWLIISCYTGQRISDFMRFNKEQIRVEGGKYLLEFTQKKTNKIMTIPLHPIVLNILNNRNGDFPKRISDQKYNNLIKVVCELAEINQPTKGSKIAETESSSKIFRKQSGIYKKYELVTSHIGRRSFATNFYGKEIPTALLINITGHSSEKMFLNYIGKSNKDLALEISKYF